MSWIIENLFSLCAVLISLSLGINTVYQSIQDRKRVKKEDSSKTRIKVTDANNDQLTLTFNAIIKHNELLIEQATDMEDDFKKMKKAYNTLLNRDAVRERREAIMLSVIQVNMQVKIPPLPELPPLVEP